MSDTVEVVREACDRMVEAERVKDLDVLRTMIWDDAVWLPPNANPVIGVDNVMALFAGFMESIPYTDITLTRIELSGCDAGDLVSAWGTLDLIIESPDDTVGMPMSFLMTWEKRDGTWKAATNMFASTSPQEIP